MNHQKQWVKSVFDAAAPKYGKEGAAFFPYFGRSLVDFSQIPPGVTALDVATGKGAVLLPLANQVGAQGSVVGIDISPNMVNMTQQLLKKNGVDWAHVREMDAEQLNFQDNTFDFVFCGFALFFFPFLDEALKEFRRVLKPNGRLVVSVWGKRPKLNAWVIEEVKKLGFNKSLATTALHSPDALNSILLQSGFCNLEFKEEFKTFWHQSGLAWWESLWSHGTRSLLESLSQLELEILQKQAIRKAEKSCSLNGVPEEMHAIFGMGTKQ